MSVSSEPSASRLICGECYEPIYSGETYYYLHGDFNDQYGIVCERCIEYVIVEITNYIFGKCQMVAK